MESSAIFDPEFSNPNAHHLTHEQAKYRDSVITEVKLYDLTLNLHKQEKYEGVLKISLNMNKSDDTLFLDFHG